MLKSVVVLVGTVLLAACATKPPPFGEVPRDAHGRPLWSEVMKKASRPEAAPPQIGADVPDPKR